MFGDNKTDIADQNAAMKWAADQWAASAPPKGSALGQQIAKARADAIKAGGDPAKAEAAAREGYGKSTKQVTYDPYGALQPGKRRYPQRPKRPQYQTSPMNLGPKPKTGPIRTHGPQYQGVYRTTNYTAFDNQIRCMNPGQLRSFNAQLKSQRGQLESQRRSMSMAPTKERRSINQTISTLLSKISRINIQLRSPKRCPGGPARPTTAQPITQNQQMPPASGGNVVSSMQVKIVKRPGREVALDAPVMDLYSTYAARGMQREANRIYRDIEDMKDGIAGIELGPPTRPRTAAPVESEVRYNAQLPMAETPQQFALEEFEGNGGGQASPAGVGEEEARIKNWKKWGMILLGIALV